MFGRVFDEFKLLLNVRKFRVELNDQNSHENCSYDDSQADYFSRDRNLILRLCRKSKLSSFNHEEYEGHEKGM